MNEGHEASLCKVKAHDVVDDVGLDHVIDAVGNDGADGAAKAARATRSPDLGTTGYGLSVDQLRALREFMIDCMLAVFKHIGTQAVNGHTQG